jgi:DnaJ-class molecular chaperone
MICPACGGTGLCSNCQGTGRETCPDCNGVGQVTETCPLCLGTGQYNGETCPTCNGLTTIRVTCPTCNGATTITCRVCNGTGKCRNCNGTGQVQTGQVRGLPRVSITGSRPVPARQGSPRLGDVFRAGPNESPLHSLLFDQMRGDAPPPPPSTSAPSVSARWGHRICGSPSDPWLI